MLWLLGLDCASGTLMRISSYKKWMKMENYVNALRERAMGEMISIGQQFEFISIPSKKHKCRTEKRLEITGFRKKLQHFGGTEHI